VHKQNNYIVFGRPDYSQDEMDAVNRVMRSGWIGMGQETALFETELAAYLGAKDVVALNSCTSALYLSLLVNGVGLGDEVIVPSFTWCSTANAVIYCGAKPVFCDIEAGSLCTGTTEILAKLTPKTRAVIVVHYGGYACDVKSLRAALPPQVSIVEDAAHALGAKYNHGGRVGSSGNLTCFSFYANKNISTGEGGAVALNDSDLANKLRRLRQQGLSQNAWSRFKDPSSSLYQEVEMLGFNFNYIDLHACIGRVQLKRFESMQQKRADLAWFFTSQLSSLGVKVALQDKVNDEEHARHLYVLRLPAGELNLSRDQLVRLLRSNGIGAAVHYMPLHRMDYYTRVSGHSHLPVTEQVFAGILSLPISASMNHADAEKVMSVFKTAISGKLAMA